MHNHGHIYRANIRDTAGRTEYSEWFNTEDALRNAMEGTTRDNTKTYTCEAKRVRCTEPDCDADETPCFVSAL